MKPQNKRLITIIIAVFFILCIPLLAMQFTAEVNWDSRDFIVMGVLLLSTGLLCELVLRTVTKLQHRILLCGFLIFMLFLIWAELAVGVFGTAFAGS